MAAKKTPPRGPRDDSDESDALFRLPLGEYTGARNALAARLKKEGRAEEAAAVKGLEKPSLSAWAVNQIYWQERKEFDDLLAATAGFRAAQAGRGDPRAALEERRQTLARLARKALDKLRDAGGSPGPETARRITNTLEALATLSSSTDLVPGRLTRDVDPPGFEAFTGLPAAGARAAGAPPPRVLPFRPGGKAAPQPTRERESREAAARRAKEVEREAQAAARRATQEAEQALRAARRAAEQAERAFGAAKKKAAEAMTEAQARAEEARQLERAAAAAAKAVAEAERRLERARAARSE